MRIFETSWARSRFFGIVSVTISSSRLSARRLWESFGNTPWGAKALTLLAHCLRSIIAASRRVPPVWMRSSTMMISFPAGFPSFMVIIRLSPSRTLAQIIRSCPGNASWKRLSAPSSGNAMTASFGRFRSERVVWSSAFTWNESKRNRSTRAWISKV